MAQKSIKRVMDLEPNLILLPERYDPRKNQAVSEGESILQFAEISKRTVSGDKAGSGRLYLIFDTGDASDGLLFPRKQPVDREGIGSTKKRLQYGDVIISRLRPYLRQVAYVDSGIAGEEFDLICSTEFYVLRSKDQSSIAFLVPFLLSDPVQEILNASQEGGHHPRFNQTTLESLKIPECMLLRKDEISSELENSVCLARNGERTIKKLISEFSKQRVMEASCSCGGQ